MRQLVLGAMVLMAATACAGTMGDTPSPEPSRTPMASESGAVPTGSAPIAIPDPIHDVIHIRGESVGVGDMVVVYRGLFLQGGGVLVSFEANKGTLDQANVLVNGQRLPLRATDAGYIAGPIGDAASAPPPGSTITLLVGTWLILFEAGPVS